MDDLDEWVAALAAIMLLLWGYAELASINQNLRRIDGVLRAESDEVDTPIGERSPQTKQRQENTDENAEKESGTDTKDEIVTCPLCGDYTDRPESVRAHISSSTDMLHKDITSGHYQDLEKLKNGKNGRDIDRVD